MEPYAAALERFATAHKAPGIELVYTSHPSWPLPENLKSTDNHGDRLLLSVLDSSFNPPTNAHLALADLPPSPAPNNAIHSFRTFDAKLLLFSIRNADKSLKPEDATPSQRLQMMVLLAAELRAYSAKLHPTLQNIAVALCQEPTFVGKSTTLKLFLKERMIALSSSRDIQLNFVVGFDTLERLFVSRYYGSESDMKDALRGLLSSSGDNSRIICAHRGSGASYSQVNASVLEAAAEYIDTGAVTLANIPEDIRTLSSSEVRERIRNASDGWQQKVPRLIAAYIKDNRLYAQHDGLY